MANLRAVFGAGELLQGRWMMVRLLAAGGFGSVYVADDLKTGYRCAVKVESLAVSKPVLKMELLVLRELSKVTEHSCQLLGCGRIPNRVTFVAMTLLGRNLYDLQRGMPDRRFTGATVARLADQCLEAIQDMHTAGFIHRDIKPANFAMGLSPPAHRIVHVIDFGLAREYRVRGTRIVAPPRANVGFRGTVRYASVTAHFGQELGRRDDLVSLLYVLVEFRSGQLPWRSVEDDERLVSRMKREYEAVRLTSGMERQYTEIGRQLLLLKYADEPDYIAFRRMIQAMQQENRYPTDGPFEWE